MIGRRRRTLCDYRPRLISDWGVALIAQAAIALLIVYLIVGPGETVLAALLGIE